MTYDCQLLPVRKVGWFFAYCESSDIFIGPTHLLQNMAYELAAFT